MKKSMIVFVALISLLFAGCGKRMEQYGAIAVTGVDLLSLSEAGEYIDPNYADALYYQSYRKGFGVGAGGMGLGMTTACSKRKAALEMAREVWTYSFKGYVAMDGVSSLIYNIGYLCSVPHKIIRGLFCMDGVVCYVGALIKLALSSVCAMVGVVTQTAVGVVCHPLETLSNLTVGILCINIDGESVTYTKYIFHTNIIASLIDLVWGAIIYPLLQTFLFWV